MKRKIGLLLGFCWLMLVSVQAQQTRRDTTLIKFKQRFLKPSGYDDRSTEKTEETTLHLMIAGNIYQTERHIDYAFDNKTGRYNFRNELKYIQPILNLGDVVIANLKTSFGGDVNNMYSAPDEFALALKYSGINVLAHANLHTAQIDRNMLKRTRDMLYEFGMTHTGAFTDGFQRNGNYPLIINKKGFRIAVLNYAALQNRPSISRDLIINEIDKTYMERDFRMLRAQKPDFTIVYFDWGANNQDIPSHYQMEMAQYCFQQGANLVVGAHPNTPMRLDYMNYFKDGNMMEGVVAYSLGNLISSNEEIRNRNGYVIDMELKRNAVTGSVRMGDWGVIPVYTHYDTSAAGKIGVYTVPCSAVESGDILAKIPYIEKRRVVNGAYEVRKLLGNTAEEIQYNLTEVVANNVMETIDLMNAPLNNRFNQTRKENVAPSEAPVLPVARTGSNNPPSIATIYEPAPKPTATAPVAKAPTPDVASMRTRIASEKSKADQLFIDNPPANTKEVTSVAGSQNNDVKPSVSNASQATLTSTPEPAKVATTTTAAPSANTEVAKASITTEATTKSTTANTTSGNTDAVSATKTNTVTTKPETVAPKEGTSTSQVSVADNVATKVTTDKTEPKESPGSKSTEQTTTYDSKTNKPMEVIIFRDDVKNKGKQVEEPQDDVARKAKQEPTYVDDIQKRKATETNLIYDTARAPRKEQVLVTEEQKAKPTPVTIPETTTTTAGVRAPTGINNNIKPEFSGDFKKVETDNASLLLDTSYRVQFYALKKFIPIDTNYYTHLKGYEVREEDGLFKYMIGKFKSYEECVRYWQSQILPRYKQSFVVEYIDGKRIFKNKE